MISSICFGVVPLGKYFLSFSMPIFTVSFWFPFSSVIMEKMVSISSRPCWLNFFIRCACDREGVKEIAVLSTSDSDYTKEINLISWNGKEPKYDIRSFSPNREKCGKGITLT